MHLSQLTSLEKETAQPCSTVTSWPIVVIFREDGTVTSSHQPVALSVSYCARVKEGAFLSLWASKKLLPICCHEQGYFTLNSNGVLGIVHQLVIQQSLVTVQVPL